MTKNSQNSGRQAWVLVLLAILFFWLRSYFWANADISHDEALSLGLYCHSLDGQQLPFWGIFRNYTLANNHMLSSAVYWLWLKVVPASSAAVIIRLPSLGFATLNLLAIGLGWRPWLGRRYAAAAACIMAASPIYSAFAYQARGYSLSMLLASLSLIGMMRLISSQGGKGQAILCLTLFLQPLVMPSAFVLAPVTAAVLCLAVAKERKDLGKALRISLPSLLCAALAAAYYLSLGEQLAVAAANAGSNVSVLWNRWSAYANVLLAFALHLGLLLLPLLQMTWRRPEISAAAPAEGQDPAFLRRLIITMLAAVLLALTAMFLAAPQKALPFPRNSLLFLPMLTFTAVLAAKQLGFFKRHLSWLLTIVLLLALLIEAFFNLRCTALIQQGKRPLSLTMQAYKGGTEFKVIAKSLRQTGLPVNCLIITQNFDLASMLWHMSAEGLNTENLHAPNTLQLHAAKPDPLVTPVIIIAQNRSQAEELAQALGNSVQDLQLLQQFKRRQLYVLR